MNWNLLLLLLSFTIALPTNSQNRSTKKYKIEQFVNCTSIRIGGALIDAVGEDFEETDVIEWRDNRQAIKVSEVLAPEKGYFTFNRENMKMRGATTIKQFFLRKSNGVWRSPGMNYAINSNFPQKRIALVVGNSNYVNDRSLSNPVLDACYVCDALKEKGFDVILELDGYKDALDADIKYFIQIAEKNGEDGVALFYYAGHGVQIDRVDYLEPCDADPRKKSSERKSECFEINEIVRVMQAKSRLQNLIIIDACRNQSSDRGTSFDFVAPGTEYGTTMLYSTKSGMTAADGNGNHSVFAESFVSNIQSVGSQWAVISQQILYDVKREIGQDGMQIGIADENFIFTPITNKSGYDSSSIINTNTTLMETNNNNQPAKTPIIAPSTENPGYMGSANGHEYVDLGLSVLWATCNVGASVPEEYGAFYSWGSCNVDIAFDSEIYNNPFLQRWKYSNSSMGKTILEYSDDVARERWKGEWRIPSVEEFQELIDNCLWTPSTKNNVEGYMITSKKNNQSIFLPKAGNSIGNGKYRNHCSYWTNSISKHFSEEANYLLITTDGSIKISRTQRYFGLSIRPVLSK